MHIAGRPPSHFAPSGNMRAFASLSSSFPFQYPVRSFRRCIHGRNRSHPLRPLAHRLPPRRRRPHRALLLALRARPAAKFILRIEDTDQVRSTAESAAGILAGHAWLGLNWDEGPVVGAGKNDYFQSMRLDLYNQHLQELIDAGRAYEAYESRRQLAAMRKAAEKAKRPFRYRRNMPGRILEPQPGRRTRPPLRNAATKTSPSTTSSSATSPSKPTSMTISSSVSPTASPPTTSPSSSTTTTWASPTSSAPRSTS